MQQYADIYLLQSDFAVNKYLHTVASGWIFINIEECMYKIRVRSYSTSVTHEISYFIISVQFIL